MDNLFKTQMSEVQGEALANPWNSPDLVPSRDSYTPPGYSSEFTSQSKLSEIEKKLEKLTQDSDNKGVSLLVIILFFLSLFFFLIIFLCLSFFVLKMFKDLKNNEKKKEEKVTNLLEEEKKNNEDYIF